MVLVAAPVQAVLLLLVRQVRVLPVRLAQPQAQRAPLQERPQAPQGQPLAPLRRVRLPPPLPLPPQVQPPQV